jgi:hypothetical protein
MRFFLIFLLVAQASLPAAFLPAAPIKLILKDGTYQMVRSYERIEERVKFFSIERNDWEELPADLVDFQATEETAKNAKEEEAAKAREIDKQAKEDSDRDGADVGQGVHLGEEYGFYAVNAGKATLLPISRAGAVLDKRRAAVNILLPGPVLKNRRLITLPGAKSATRFPRQPAGLFIVSESKSSRFVLLRVKVKGDHRELEAILTSPGGKSEQGGDQIEMLEVVVSSQTTRLVPQTPLVPGEYALVEIIDDKLNLYVADFGIGAS